MDNKVTDRKIQEAALVKAAYRRKKFEEDGLTQEILAEEFGVTQAMVSQWFQARARIPDSTLLMLSGRLGFDPLEVRPELRDKYLLAKQVLVDEEQVGRLQSLLETLTDDELSQIELLVEMLVARRDKAAKT